MKEMEIKISLKGNYIKLEEVVKKIKKIEKEYSCNCTLLEVEATII